MNYVGAWGLICQKVNSLNTEDILLNLNLMLQLNVIIQKVTQNYMYYKMGNWQTHNSAYGHHITNLQLTDKWIQHLFI